MKKGDNMVDMVNLFHSLCFIINSIYEICFSYNEIRRAIQ